MSSITFVAPLWHTHRPFFGRSQGATQRRIRNSAPTDICRRPISPTARSLDSYRQGARFDPERTPKQFSIGNGKPKPAHKPFVTLVKALTLKKVASVETCGLLIRTGSVCVNDVIVRDEKARVHRTDDVLSVQGKEIGCVESNDALYETESELTSLPRNRRDLSRGSEGDEEELGNRRIDGGFFARKRKGYRR